MSELELTGERYIPGMSTNIRLEHMHRYIVARELVKGKRVLDIASGEGYGSYILSQKAMSVVGVDIGKDAVEHASNTYHNENLEYLEGSCTEIPLPDHSIDVIISFETIEHIGSEEQHAFMSEIKRVLKPNGVLLLSSPDKHEYSDVPSYKNEYHIKELYKDELCDLINANFKNQKIYGQRIKYGSLIASTEESESSFINYDNKYDGIKNNEIDNFIKPLYFLVLASDETINDLPSSIYEENIQESEEYLAAINIIIARDKDIAELTQVITVKDADITVLNQVIAARDNGIAELTHVVNAKDGDITGFNQVIKQKDSCIAELIQNSDTLLYAAQFIPKHMVFPNSWVGHIPFGAWLITGMQPQIFVELGTHTGNSYLGFCQAVYESGQKIRCYAVDHWRGDEHASFYANKAYDELREYHDPLYSSFSELIRSSFDEALSRFEDGSIDLLHIDGLHTYEAVKHDFESWLPKVAPDGVILFHDICVHKEEFGVWKLWDELCTQYKKNMSFQHSSGLGVLQVGPGKDSKKLDWLIPSSPSHKKILDYFTALGETNISRYEFQEQTTHVQILDQIIVARDRGVVELNQSIAELNKAIVARDRGIAELTQALDFIRSSVSWRLTAPLRCIKRLVMNVLGLLVRKVRSLLKWALMRCSPKVQNFIQYLLACFRGITQSRHNFKAIKEIVTHRYEKTKEKIVRDSVTSPCSQELPPVDISVVTYNSDKWVDSFVDSFIKLDYPKNRLNIYFVDNDSTDSTVDSLRTILPKLQDIGVKAEILQRPNLGFGAGHNAAIAVGKAPYCLVTNIDLTFTPESLSKIVVQAVNDDPCVAAWELRQKPYEHPKFYDPVTGTTNWNSHACVLLRRSALDEVGGYDETLFMYGEDVELSYRLRRAGYLLRYCPQSVVWHYTYENENTVKPLQYTGSTFSNLYIRLKYGNWIDIATIPSLVLGLLLRTQVYPGSRRALFQSFIKLAFVAPKALTARLRSKAAFPFNGLDYDLTREGAFVRLQSCPPVGAPLVSVITRTYKGRGLYLRQALLSVAHQTYPYVEHIIVEDGGKTQQKNIEGIRQTTGRDIRFIPLDKVGRSKAGNIGLAEAQGQYCLFLDDDDLLFSDHIEVLVQTLRATPEAVAAYSLAWEVVTDSKGIDKNGYTEVSHLIPHKFRQEFDLKVLQSHNYLPIQSVLFERRLFEERGGFEENKEVLEDWNLWNRYAFGNRFIYVPKVTSMYRTPADLADIAKRNQEFSRAYQLTVLQNEEQVESIRKQNFGTKVG